MVRIDVTVNVAAVTNLEEKISKAMERGLRDLTVGAHRVWTRAAGGHLHKTKRNYMMALSHHKVDAHSTEIVLHHPDNKVNWLVTALEVGYGAIDVKKALLASSAAKSWSQYSSKPGQKKIGGPFLDVPFKKGQSNNPTHFRRVNPASTGWQHQGFRPIGKGGLATPLREEAKKYLHEEGPRVLKAIFDAIGKSK